MSDKEPIGNEVKNSIQSWEYSLYENQISQCLSNEENNESRLNTPFSVHWKLSLRGSDIVDKNWEKFQLRWVCPVMYMQYSAFTDKSILQSLRDNRWCNVIRLALYTETKIKDWAKAYCQNEDEKNRLIKWIEECIKNCKELWIYVIIDWHILHDKSPLIHEEEAKEFFENISEKFKNYDNIIYEICNEPNNTSWEDIKSYANTIIPIIRKNNKNSIIVIGTPNRAQDINIKKEDRIDWENIMYAFHFYAATHKDKQRKKLLSALENWVPVFITEFGICECTWDWIIDEEEAEKWFKIIDDYNLSYCAWNLSEYWITSSILKPSPEFEWLKETWWNNNSEKIDLTEDKLSEYWKIILNRIKWDTENKEK